TGGLIDEAGGPVAGKPAAKVRKRHGHGVGNDRLPRGPVGPAAHRPPGHHPRPGLIDKQPPVVRPRIARARGFDGRDHKAIQRAPLGHRAAPGVVRHGSRGRTRPPPSDRLEGQYTGAVYRRHGLLPREPHGLLLPPDRAHKTSDNLARRSRMTWFISREGIEVHAGTRGCDTGAIVTASSSGRLWGVTSSPALGSSRLSLPKAAPTPAQHLQHKLLSPLSTIHASPVWLLCLARLTGGFLTTLDPGAPGLSRAPAMVQRQQRCWSRCPGPYRSAPRTPGRPPRAGASARGTHPSCGHTRFRPWRTRGRRATRRPG